MERVEKVENKEIGKPDFRKAVERFNHFRSPEATAEITAVEGDVITLKFSGPFCRSCGVYDYFEDLIYFLDGKARILDYKKVEDGFVVRYKLEGGLD